MTSQFRTVATFVKTYLKQNYQIKIVPAEVVQAKGTVSHRTLYRRNSASPSTWNASETTSLSRKQGQRWSALENIVLWWQFGAKGNAVNKTPMKTA
jgi:hypothetical protein